MKTPILTLAGASLAVGSAVLLSSCGGTLGKPPGRGGKVSPQERFEKHDTNRDGKWSYSEFLTTSLAKKSANPRSLFNAIDANNDDYVTQGELLDYRRKLKGR